MSKFQVPPLIFRDTHTHTHATQGRPYRLQTINMWYLTECYLCVKNKNYLWLSSPWWWIMAKSCLFYLSKAICSRWEYNLYFRLRSQSFYLRTSRQLYESGPCPGQLLRATFKKCGRLKQSYHGDVPNKNNEWCNFDQTTEKPRAGEEKHPDLRFQNRPNLNHNRPLL